MLISLLHLLQRFVLFCYMSLHLVSSAVEFQGITFQVETLMCWIDTIVVLNIELGLLCFRIVNSTQKGLLPVSMAVNFKSQKIN